MTKYKSPSSITQTLEKEGHDEKKIKVIQALHLLKDYTEEVIAKSKQRR